MNCTYIGHLKMFTLFVQHKVVRSDGQLTVRTQGFDLLKSKLVIGFERTKQPSQLVQWKYSVVDVVGEIDHPKVLKVKMRKMDVETNGHRKWQRSHRFQDGQNVFDYIVFVHKSAEDDEPTVLKGRRKLTKTKKRISRIQIENQINCLKKIASCVMWQMVLIIFQQKRIETFFQGFVAQVSIEYARRLIAESEFDSKSCKNDIYSTNTGGLDLKSIRSISTDLYAAYTWNRTQLSKIMILQGP